MFIYVVSDTHATEAGEWTNLTKSQVIRSKSHWAAEETPPMGDREGNLQQSNNDKVNFSIKRQNKNLYN